MTKYEFVNQWIKGQKEFEDINLDNIDLKEEDYEGVVFRNSIIAADFRGSNLACSQFINCNIKTSDFRNADLTNALFEQVSFEGSRFKGAKIDGFIFKNNYCYSRSNIGQNDFNEWVKDIE